MSISLAAAFRFTSPGTIALIGSGGKTTAIFRLARELKQPTVVTATSHMGTWQLTLADQHIVAKKPGDLSGLDPGLSNVTLITGAIDADRTKPVPDDVLEVIRKFCRARSLPLLVEADGSRQKPLKLWAEHEPPVPDFADIVVQVAGISGIGRRFSEETVHRANLLADTVRLKIGEEITAEAFTRILLHDANPGGRIPARARRILLLNQADTAELQSMARGMADGLLSKFHSVIVSSLANDAIYAVHEPVAGIILAAGGSVRFGSSKPLLDWHGEPFVRVVARKAIEARLAPVMVVTGAHAIDVETALQGLDVKVVRNEDWEKGQAESIKAGLRNLLSVENRRAGACIFLLADQPHITMSVMKALTEKHAEGLYPIVAPMVMDRRANPVLFDRVTFPDLLTLAGDVGGRAVFHKHSVEYLPWHDDRLLLDIDTPEQYRRLLDDESL